MVIISISGTRANQYVVLPLLPSHVETHVCIKLLALTFTNCVVTNNAVEITFDNVALENTVVQQKGRAFTFVAVHDGECKFLPVSKTHCVYSTRLPDSVIVTLGPKTLLQDWTNAQWTMFLEINNL